MAAAIITEPTEANNYYGSVKFTIDGTDYSGTYKSSSIGHDRSVKNYTYVVRMTTSRNFAGTTLYNFTVGCNVNGHGSQFSCTRKQGETLELCSGAEVILDYATELTKKWVKS